MTFAVVRVKLQKCEDMSQDTALGIYKTAETHVQVALKTVEIWYNSDIITDDTGSAGCVATHYETRGPWAQICKRAPQHRYIDGKRQNPQTHTDTKWLSIYESLWSSCVSFRSFYISLWLFCVS